MENLFSQIIGKNYQPNNPSAQEFRLITRQILVNSQTTHNREANCEEYIDFLLFNSSNMSKIKCLEKRKMKYMKLYMKWLLLIFTYILYIFKFPLILINRRFLIIVQSKMILFRILVDIL